LVFHSFSLSIFPIRFGIDPSHCGCSLKILHISREYQGLGEAGGVKDVVRGMAESLSRFQENVTVFHPYYAFLHKRNLECHPLWVGKPYGLFEASVEEIFIQGVRILLVNTPWFVDRLGIYTITEAESLMGMGETGTGYPCEFERSLSFQIASAWYLKESGEVFDVLHAHDAHTGVFGALVSIPRKFFTIHNAGISYQQNTEKWSQLEEWTRLGETALEKGRLDRMFSPILFAFSHSMVFTVSSYYAKEILEEDGHGESGLLGPRIRENQFHLTGIFNGLDFSQREFSDLIPQDGNSLSWISSSTSLKKNKNLVKLQFLREAQNKPFLGPLPKMDIPWMIFQGRLTYQKGIDELIDIAENTHAMSQCALIFMGTGEEKYMNTVASLAKTPENPASLTYFPFYDELFIKYLFGAGDFFLGPSVYEPCALTDLMAMRMGTIPLVRATGGLQKVREGIDGFLYHEKGGLRNLIAKGIDIYTHHDELHFQLARQAFQRTENFQWDPIITKFWIPVYKGLEPEWALQ